VGTISDSLLQSFENKLSLVAFHWPKVYPKAFLLKQDNLQMAAKTYIVEHLDEELGPWSELEYVTIAKECNQAGAKFCLSSVPPNLALPEVLKAVPGFTADGRSVETIYASDKSRVCLLDPAATKELSPEDGEVFDVFLFGGILGW
jgi:ribosome biogenesis SPOUT family RNA methylase Rps3